MEGSGEENGHIEGRGEDLLQIISQLTFLMHFLKN